MIVPKIRIAPGKAGVVLDGEIVLVQIVEVETPAHDVAGQQSRAADEDREVGAHVQPRREALEQVRDRHVAAVVVDEAMVGEGVETRAGRADVIGAWSGPGVESAVGDGCWSEAGEERGDVGEEVEGEIEDLGGGCCRCEGGEGEGVRAHLRLDLFCGRSVKSLVVGELRGFVNYDINLGVRFYCTRGFTHHDIPVSLTR